VSARGDLFPCSEFIGLKKFKGGNLFQNDIKNILKTEAFKLVTSRKVEDIEPCARCAIRHFCGAPCPAEAYEMNGGMNRPGAFCELYEEQVRYAFRCIVEGTENDYLWDNWDLDTTTTIDITYK
ncbi:MAG: SPASM domain-containing protein, partial [Candidatus Omnitrophota bacterium]